MDDFGLLVGRHFTALPTLSDEQLSELMLDSLGRVIISGRYLEDSAHVSGDAGIFVMGVRNDADASLTDADGDYSPIAVDEFGRVKVLADLDVDFDYVYDEDSAHTTADPGAYVLAVRADTRPTNANTDTDGDYASFFVNANGELYVHDTDVLTELLDQGTTLDNIDTSLNNIEASVASIDTEIQSLTHVEDTQHSSGHVGTMPLAVRNDADTSLVDTDGDYAPLQVNSVGRLKTETTFTPPGSEAYTVTDALAAAGDGLETITAAATPWVTVASLAVGDGETAYVYGWQWACDQNAQARIVTDDTADVIVYKTTVNSSATPGMSEHFAESGRIEIPGATDLEIKLQIKKRSTTGGNANGTGSMHIRTF